MLIKAGADVNAPGTIDAGYTALEAAVEGGNRVAIDILLEAAANAPHCHRGFRVNWQSTVPRKVGCLRLVRAQFKGRRRFAHFFHAEFAN